MNDSEFRQLLDHLGLSWDGYRKVRKGVKKRIRRQMQALGCRTLEAYLLALEQDSEARHHCQRLMTVSMSRFFRDRGLWDALQRRVLPGLIENNKIGVRVWSAGCACGEEVYSMKILWETIRKDEPLPDLEVWATDLNPDYLGRAQVGIYPRSSLKEVPEALKPVFFRSVQRRQNYAIAEAMKKGIVWRVHNLLSDPPLGQFQLIFLRNSLLTYYKQALREPAFQKVVDSLAQGGFLIIGAHEKIPSGVRTLLPFGSHPWIFQKAN